MDISHAEVCGLAMGWLSVYKQLRNPDCNALQTQINEIQERRNVYDAENGMDPNDYLCKLAEKMQHAFDTDPVLKAWNEQDDARIASDPEYALRVQEADKAIEALSDKDILNMMKAHPDFQPLLKLV